MTPCSWYFLTASSFVLSVLGNVQSAPVLTTSTGTFEGLELKTNVSVFLGIPYANKPLRERRFKDPDPLEAFTDRRHQVKKAPPPCYSSATLRSDASEDCLYVSLFLAHKTSTANLLVVFTNNKVDSTVLADVVSNKLAVAVVHFREYLFGLLTNDESTGNYGIADIRLALDWLTVNANNIGVKKEFILMAEGNAATLVHVAVNYLTETPIRAILFNGNLYSRRNPRTTQNARRLIKEVACDLPSPSQAMDCLRAKPTTELLQAVEKLAGDTRQGKVYIKRLQDDASEYGEPFGVVQNATALGAKRQFPLLLAAPIPLNSVPTASAYNWTEFKTFLARLISDKEYTNGPLLRRLALHEYVHARGDKRDGRFLHTVSRQMLRDRDFYAPFRKVANEWKQPLWTATFAVEQKPLEKCLAAAGNDLLCEEFWNLVTTFTLGRDPAEATSKHALFDVNRWNSISDVSLSLFRAQNAFWNELLPLFNQLELTGRRYEFLNDDIPIPDPLEEEDDEQQWHRSASPGLTNDQLEAEFERDIRTDL